MYREIVSIIAEHLIYILPIIALGAWLMQPKKDKFIMGWHGVIAVAIGFCVAFIVGELFYNPRPFVATGVEPFFYHVANNGFPSSHMLAASLIAGTVFLSSRTFGSVLILCAVAIGASRALAYVHSWIDIIASALIAVVSILIARAVVSKIPKNWLYIETDHNDSA
jgi:undecaprenyl-diphosphatase